MGAAEGRTNRMLYPPPPCSGPFRRRHPETGALPRLRFPGAAAAAVPLPRSALPPPLMNIQRLGAGRAMLMKAADR